MRKSPFYIPSEIERETGFGKEQLRKWRQRFRFPRMNDGMRSAVKLLREKGMGTKQIPKRLQIGVGTVYGVISV